MFNQQSLLLCLLVLVLLYLSVKAYNWWQTNKRELFYHQWHRDNERIGRESLMIQLEEVRKQRDEIASQLMAVRLESEYIRLGNANLVDIEKAKTEKDIIDKFKGVKMTEFKPASRVDLLKVCRDFINDFEGEYLAEDGNVIDGTNYIMEQYYRELKALLK